MTDVLTHSFVSEVAGYFNTCRRDCGAHTVHGRRASSYVTGGLASRFCRLPLFGPRTADDPIRLRARSSGVFWDRICWRGEEGDGQKLLILSKGLFHSAEFAPIRGSSNKSFEVLSNKMPYKSYISCQHCRDFLVRTKSRTAISFGNQRGGITVPTE